MLRINLDTEAPFELGRIFLEIAATSHGPWQAILSFTEFCVDVAADECQIHLDMFDS